MIAAIQSERGISLQVLGKSPTIPDLLQVGLDELVEPD
jgi:hypothetical protein